MSSITDIGKVRREERCQIPEDHPNGKIYYDTIVNPIYDEQGKLVGVYTAGRSINEMVESYHRQQEGTRQLKEMTQQMQEYIDNINIALRVSEVRLMNYLPDTHELEISNDLNTEEAAADTGALFDAGGPGAPPPGGHPDPQDGPSREHTHRPDRADNPARQEGSRRLAHLQHHPDVKVPTAASAITSVCAATRRRWSQRTAAEGGDKESPGDGTAERRLPAEHELRDTYTAERRTGFCRAVQCDHPPEEEPVFIRQIKKNANLLLQLVNDILFISRLDAHMVEIKKEPTDFAMLFDGWCHQGWTHHNAEVSTSIENPYDHLIVDIDDTNLLRPFRHERARAYTTAQALAAHRQGADGADGRHHRLPVGTRQGQHRVGHHPCTAICQRKKTS